MKTKEDKSVIQLCPIRNVVSRFGDKWSLLILLLLSENEVLRYNQLAKMIPDISQKMLANTLRMLEADKLISRKVYPEVPPKVEYKLTEIGGSLIPHIQGITQWALTHMDEIYRHRMTIKK